MERMGRRNERAEKRAGIMSCHLGKEILTHAKINGIDRPFRGKMCVMSVVVTKWGMIDDERATALLLGAEIYPSTQEEK
jgi:hypothetical protein